MSRSRLNPWPAFADLFAALLVATFGGLFIISLFAGKLQEDLKKYEDVEKTVSDLTGEMEDLRTEVRIAEQQAEELREETTALTQKVRNLQGVLADREDTIEELRKGGIDPPPCLVSDAGNIVPLLEIEVHDEGLAARPLSTSRHSGLLESVPNLNQLEDQGRMSYQRFLGVTRPIRNWARNPENDLGFSCVFYAVIRIQTSSKEALSKGVAYVDDSFFISNPNTIDRSIKN